MKRTIFSVVMLLVIATGGMHFAGADAVSTAVADSPPACEPMPCCPPDCGPQDCDPGSCDRVKCDTAISGRTKCDAAAVRVRS
jgi:hypothetical protein